VTVRLSTRGERDLRRLDPQVRRRIVAGLQALDSAAANLDIKPIKGSPPWFRLRVGEHRVLYRTIQNGFLVERIVSRQDLEKGVRTLE